MKLVLALLMLPVCGCGQQLGALLYLMTPPTKTIPAEYTLPPGPILILVDDDQGLIRPPIARFALVDELAKDFKAHKIADNVTTNEEIARIRQAEPKFDQRGARELGQKAEADTVILLSTREFMLDDDLEVAATAGRFTVSVRVINAKAEARDQVRLWPPQTTERDGRLVAATVGAHELRAAKSVQAAHEKLAEALAAKIGELFHDVEVEN